MYLERVKIENVKLIDELDIDFTNEEGDIRRWTVLIGRNGRGKTAVLQSIALAAAGATHVNDLGKSVAASYRPRHKEDTRPQIQADFRLEAPPKRGRKARRRRELPGIGDEEEAEVVLSSRVELPVGWDVFNAESSYRDAEDTVDPLQTARAKGLPYWFVAAYGVSRHLRLSEGASHPPTNAEFHLERLRSIFSPDAILRGIGFIEQFDTSKSHLYSKFLQELTRRSEALLPELMGMELRGHGGVTRVEDLMERDRIFQRLPQGTELKLPATWLSHGYQSSLAWLSDLLGHFLLEDSTFDRAKKAAPSELQGLVLIDELDMHLHPTWQTTFVAALRETFPNIQFIVTTHSPLLLSGLRPEEIVLLELDDESGAIVRREFEELDPRLMTGSEIFQEFFELDTVWSQELGRILDDYNFWSQNPHRDEHHDKMLEQWRSRLMEEGVPVNEPVEKSEP